MEDLLSILSHATEQVPYYKKITHKNSTNPIAWLKELPVVDKQL